MLSFIKGTIAEIGADYVVLENHGIGYLTVSYTHLTLPTILRV